ncbi:C-terminal domain of 1-Cys peroxiredoxin [Gryganskiella cystojenkinii]|nr:C-terminal domain of 1-Cys peroxiredoxin [Gryganskiella cystojenkinii]
MVASVGKIAPAFKATAVVDGEFKEVSLEQYKGQYVVLFFYPLDFTFVCPTEIIAFSEAIERFSGLKTAVLACSCDSEFSHLAWVNTPRNNGGLGEMKIPIIADFTKKIATDYGVLKEDEGVAYRGLFIIDPKQVVRQITINDLPVGRNVDEVVRLVEAFQFTDEHGEVCPIGWQKGQATIKPDVAGSKDFFASSA